MSARPYVGVDWDSGSWLAVSHDSSGEFSAVAESNIEEIWDRFSTAERIVLDVPIGLCSSCDPEEGDCECDGEDQFLRPYDRLVRLVLEYPRSTSVFNAPARGAIEVAIDGASYQDVNQTNKDLARKGLSKQSANLADGIHAVYQLLEDENCRGRLAEVHPEICPRAFAEESLRHSKKTAPGSTTCWTPSSSR